MTKKYFFLAGLPRSGSTLLSSILNQNPNIYCSHNESSICDLIYKTELHFETSDEYQSYPNENGKQKVCKSVIENYYQNKNQTFIIDKCRAWGTPGNLNIIRKYITTDIKIICPVRPIVEILASFIHLFNQNPDKKIFIDSHIESNGRYFYRPLDDIRCDEIMKMNGIIDRPLFSLSQSKLPENKNIFHIVEYDDLIQNTKKVIQNIYDFLEIDYFEHDFENIRTSTEINHEYYGLPDLHKLRKSINKCSPDPKEILSDYIINKYKDYQIWR